MNPSTLILCIALTLAQQVLGQNTTTVNKANVLPSFDTFLQLETKTDTTANVSFGDFDGDGHLDILLVKGRHWPIVDRVLLGDGRGGIRTQYDLGTAADQSYTGAVADFNGDHFPDIAISNDHPDKKLIYINDGKGRFTVGSEFGVPQWPTRNMSVADLNNDGLPDLILANRGRAGKTSNYYCLNEGNGKFTHDCIAFARYPATTITPADFNKDGIVDLIVPYRDKGQSFLYLGSKSFTYSDSSRIPFGPPDATIRMAASADFNKDNFPDIVTVDERKGVDLYLGQENQTFAHVSLADEKVFPYALAIADLNNDGYTDVIVGHGEAPSTVFFNDGSGRRFTPISFGDAKGTVYGFAVADFNEDGHPDIAAARSDAANVVYFGTIKTRTRK
jgi:hypothetical protein